MRRQTLHKMIFCLMMITVTMIFYNNYTVQATSMLTPPSSLKAELQISDQRTVVLTWQPSKSLSGTGTIHYDIYRSLYPNHGFESINHYGTTDTRYVDDTCKPGITYYYYIIAYRGYAEESEMSNHASVTIPMETMIVSGKAIANQQAELSFRVDIDEYEGFDIFRKDVQGGSYAYIGNVIKQTSYWWVDEYTYIDKTSLKVGNTYDYQVKAYVMIDGNKYYIAAGTTNVMILLTCPKIKTAKRVNKFSAKLTWNKVSGAAGYYIYRIDNTQSDYGYRNTENTGYKRVKTITNPNTLTYQFKKQKHGVTYTYKIAAYQVVGGKKVEGVLSDVKSVTMNYYAYERESYYERYTRIFGKKDNSKKYSSDQKARKYMTTVKIKVWDFQRGKSGKKVTKIKYLTVNKKIAPTVKQMFHEIYKSKEKQVIRDIGAYSYRPGQHMYGLAIDVNPNENYMIRGKTIVAGSYWKPKTDPYSIPNNSEFVRIMRKYGFIRGEWGDTKDYMHFSYFGT